MALKRLVLLLTFFACRLAASAQTDTSSFHLRNAWEAAQWLYAAENGTVQLSDRQRSQLLGSLLWYGNVTDREYGNTYDLLANRLKRYPALSGVAGTLISELVTVEKFFTSDKVTKCDVGNDTIKIRAQRYRKEFDAAEQNLKDLKAMREAKESRRRE